MLQLICHLFGDYVFQNHWMAVNKVKRSDAALIHALEYTLFFLMLTQSWLALLVIFSTHFVIDRFRLAGYWCRFWGVGCPGSLWQRKPVSEPYSPTPEALAIWLPIVVDNSFHLFINYVALALWG